MIDTIHRLWYAKHLTSNASLELGPFNSNEFEHILFIIWISIPTFNFMQKVLFKCDLGQCSELTMKGGIVLPGWNSRNGHENSSVVAEVHEAQTVHSGLVVQIHIGILFCIDHSLDGCGGPHGFDHVGRFGNAEGGGGAKYLFHS